MRWLIVEDALRARKGHWVEYVSTFVRELRVLGDEVVVLCDRKAQGFVMEQTGARPVLPESIWHRMGDGAGAVKRYLRVPGHAIATLFAMRKEFRGFNHGLHGLTRMGKAQGDAQGTCAGAAFSNPFASKLARDSENTSPTRTANDPSAPGEYSSSVPIRDIRGSNFVTLDSGPSPLDSGEAPDWIFVPTVLVHHLLGWWLLLKTGSLPKESRVLLFFPNLPIRLDDAGKAHWNRGPTTKLMAWLFKQLRGEVENGKVVLGVETHAMRRALEGLIRLPVVYLPHPVEAQGGTRVERRASRASSPATSHSLPATSAKPIVFGCYGAARWEKGSDIFQEAIRLILRAAERPMTDSGLLIADGVPGAKALDAGRSTLVPSLLAPSSKLQALRFCIQWVEDFQDDSGNLISIDPWLREHPQVEVIGRYFEGDEYERRLAQTDVMVLPYRKPYQLRVSRVVIEAMLNGMPVIATRGTTLFEQAEEHGVVVGCEEGDAESLAEAMLEVAERFEVLRASAEEKVNAAAESFSVGYFRKLISKQNDS